jgi:Mrp family chromosome partitioning ATPase
MSDRKSDCPSAAECPSGGDCQNCRQSPEDLRIREVLGGIPRKYVVMSGKGGVGKSTVAVNLALALAQEGKGKRVGVLDIDLHGPSVPRMLHLEGERLAVTPEGRFIPMEAGPLEVMSVGFILDSPDTAVILRGPMKIGLIRQFVAQVEWGKLDALVIDVPPGTGDEPLTICQLLQGDPGAAAVVVTTPQRVSEEDVSKSVDFCNKLPLRVAGLVENMSGFVCPHCGGVTDVFSSGAGERLAAEYGIEFLGKIPLDPMVCAGGDDGMPFMALYDDNAPSKVFREIALKLGTKTAE